MDRPAITVSRLEDADRARWDAFVRAEAGASFFHLSGWKPVLEEVLRHRCHYLQAERAGEIVAVLPLAEVKSRLFGHGLVSLPFCVHAGIAGAAEAIGPLEAAAEAVARQLGVQHLEYRNATRRHDDWPRQDLYVTFRKALLPKLEDNLLAVPRKQRAMVRKGIGNGLASEVDAGPERFFALYADNMRRHGTPALPLRFFARLLAEFGPQCDILTVKDRAGTPVSAVLSFYFRGEVLPYYAGDTPAARALAANDFKYWELMRRAWERGCRGFDFGRSKVGSGSWSFKRNWGFEPQPLSYEYRLYRRRDVPQNNPANPKYRAFIALWRRLPLPVANALGPHIVRCLG